MEKWHAWRKGNIDFLEQLCFHGEVVLRQEAWTRRDDWTRQAGIRGTMEVRCTGDSYKKIRRRRRQKLKVGRANASCRWFLKLDGTSWLNAFAKRYTWLECSRKPNRAYANRITLSELLDGIECTRMDLEIRSVVNWRTSRSIQK